MKLKDLKGRSRDQAIAQIRATVRGLKQKQNREPALDKEESVPQIHTPCCFRVTCFKKGHNWDTNNIETKAILDAIVEGGVIPDDRILEVPEEYKEGIEVKTKEEEHTEVQIVEL